MCFGHAPRNRQPQAGATAHKVGLTGAVMFKLSNFIEMFKNLELLFGRDPTPVSLTVILMKSWGCCPLFPGS